jgi:PAS domain S-box-containing protein
MDGCNSSRRRCSPRRNWRVSTGEILWSDETFRIFEYDPATKPTVELILQRVHPEDRAFTQQTIDRASREEKDFEHEYRLLMPDGSVKHVHVVAHAISDESGSIEFAGAVMDITAAKEAEDRIRRIINTVPGLLWSARPDGWIHFISQRWLDYTGMTLEQGLGWGWQPAFHPDDLEQVLSKWRAALAEGKPFEAETALRRFDGEYRWFLGRAFPLLDRSGKISGWYGGDFDIDDRKLAEERIREQEEALRQAQADLAHASRLTTMGELAASVAHEVNQPLSGVVVNGNACLRWLAGDSPNLDEARESVRRIVRDGKRAGDVIARIRALATKTAPAKERLDMNEAIREVVALARDELRKNSVAVRTEFADDLSPVLGDRVQLQQAVLNLVMNGIEAMSNVDERPRELIIRLIRVSPFGRRVPRRRFSILRSLCTI